MFRNTFFVPVFVGKPFDDVENSEIHHPEVDTNGIKDLTPFILVQNPIACGTNSDILEAKLSVFTTSSRLWEKKPTTARYFKKTVVVKQAREFLVSESVVYNEIRVWNKVQRHKNILGLIGKAHIGAQIPSMVSPYCEMGSLHSFIFNVLDLNYASLVFQVLNALHHVHSLGVVHGDIKPENVILTMAAPNRSHGVEMVAKLGDFGCARDVNSLESKNANYDGSYLYQSPEIISQDSPEPSVEGDIWAVGCLMFVVACRKEPYHWIKNKWNVPFHIGANEAPHSSEDVWPEDLIKSVAQSCWAISEARPTAGQLIQQMLQFPQLVVSSFESFEPADGDAQDITEWEGRRFWFCRANSGIESGSAGFVCPWPGCESLGFATKQRLYRHRYLHRCFDFQIYRECRQISGVMGVLEDYLFSRVSTVHKGNMYRDISFSGTLATGDRIHQSTLPPPLVLCEHTSKRNYMLGEGIIINKEPQSLSERSYTGLQFGTYRGHKVVIKSFRPLPEQAIERDSEQHFFYDLRTSKIRHRYLLKLHGLCYINDITALLKPASVIPYYPNGDLLQYRGRLDYFGQLKMLIEILEGLRAMHAHDPPLVHKCLKASNILIDESGSPQINLISFEHFVVMTQEPAPSPSYSENWQVVSRWWSPEVYSDVHEFGVVDVDTWAFGCVALEVFTGEMPYGPFDTGPELVAQILSGTPPDIGLSTTLPAAVWQDVRRCWIPMYEPSGELPTGTQLPRPRSEELINMFRGHIMRESFNSLADITDQVTREAIPISTGHSSNLYLGTMKNSSNNQEKIVTVENISSTPYYHTRDKDLLVSATKCIRQRAHLNHPKMCKQFGLIYPSHLSMPEIRTGRDNYDVYPSLVMEHCNGGFLMEYLSRYHLRLDQKICLIRDILDVLDYLHEQEMIWGNLHPSSVFVDEHGGAKLGGLSNCLISPVRVRVKASIAHMRYLSPEQMQEEPQAPTPAMDIWAMGCLAMQILTGLEPFEWLKSQYDIDQGVRTGVLPFEPSGHLDGYGDLYPMLAMCWNVDPSQRPSAATLLEILNAL